MCFMTQSHCGKNAFDDFNSCYRNISRRHFKDQDHFWKDWLVKWQINLHKIRKYNFEKKQQSILQNYTESYYALVNAITGYFIQNIDDSEKLIFYWRLFDKLNTYGFLKLRTKKYITDNRCVRLFCIWNAKF